ncbi:ICE family protease (caspase) p20 domain-containing protein [Toxoplasma gondii VAND]|uniref:ICE family protease (Caspase) p20 domain-containing protein n=2 Tax=Toxoplasma gondii TaxID=5811 RepID=A0A086Q9D0_TOXGO|nr:ICE family protease (caspase) p20 domain-containing protein [Toxoplasma gondii VAND]
MTSYTPYSFTSSLDRPGAPVSGSSPSLAGVHGSQAQNGTSEHSHQSARMYYYPVNTARISFSEETANGGRVVQLPTADRSERNLSHSVVAGSYSQGGYAKPPFFVVPESRSGFSGYGLQEQRPVSHPGVPPALGSVRSVPASSQSLPSLYATGGFTQPGAKEVSSEFAQSTVSLRSPQAVSSRPLCHPATSWSCPAPGPVPSSAEQTSRTVIQPGPPLAVFPSLPLQTTGGLQGDFSRGRSGVAELAPPLAAGRSVALPRESVDQTLQRLEAAKAFEANRLQDLMKQERELLMHFAQKHQAGNARAAVAERGEAALAEHRQGLPARSTRVLSGPPTSRDGSAFVAEPQCVSSGIPQSSSRIPRLPSFATPHVRHASFLPPAFPAAPGQPCTASFILPRAARPASVHAARGPRRRALIVGCGHQKGQPYHIRGAGNDAHLFAHACVQFLGIDPKEICVLTDTAPSTCYRGRGQDGSFLGPAAYIQGKDGSKHGTLLAKQDRMHAAGGEETSGAASALSQAMRGVADFGAKHFVASQGRDKETKAVVHSLVDVDRLESEEPNPVVAELPTRHNILRGLRWLVEDARPDDYLIFYFSGHSVQMDNMSGWEGEGYEEAFVPCDFNVRDVESGDPVSLVGALEIREILFNIPDRTQLSIFLDCCGGQTVLDPAGTSSRFTFIKGVKQRGMWPFSDPTDKMCLAKYRSDVWASPDMQKQVVQPRYLPAVEVQSLSCVSTASVKGDEHEKPGLLNAYCIAAAPWGSVALEASFNSFRIRSFHTRSLPGNCHGSCTVESKPVVHGVFTWAVVSALSGLVEETIRVFSDEGGARNGCVPVRVTYTKLMEKIEHQINDLKWNRLFKLDQQAELTVHSGGGARPNEVFIQFPDLAPGKGRPCVGASLSGETSPGACLRGWATAAFDSPVTPLQELSGSFYDFFHPQWIREEQRMHMGSAAAGGALPYTAEACFQRAFGVTPTGSPTPLGLHGKVHAERRSAGRGEDRKEQGSRIPSEDHVSSCLQWLSARRRLRSVVLPMASGFLDPRNRPVASASFSPLYTAKGRPPISSPPQEPATDSGHIPEHFKCTDVSTLSPSSCVASVENQEAQSPSNDENALFSCADSCSFPSRRPPSGAAPHHEGQARQESRGISQKRQAAVPQVASGKQVVRSEKRPEELQRERSFGLAVHAVRCVGGRDEEVALAVVLRAQMAERKRREAANRAQREQAEVRGRQMRLRQSLRRIESLKRTQADKVRSTQIQINPQRVDRAAVARLNDANFRIPFPTGGTCPVKHVLPLLEFDGSHTHNGDYKCQERNAKKYNYTDGRSLVLVARAMPAPARGVPVKSGKQSFFC